MAMDLIFLRHGIAEERTPDREDYSRKLTEKGEKKLYDTLPNLLPFIDLGEEVLIWTSPLIRAKETAKILSNVLKVAKIKEYGFIEDGDFTDFLTELKTLDFSRKHTLIVVGHEPFLSEWSYELSSTRLPYKKGAAAGFKVSSMDISDAELVWFLQPFAMETLGKG